MVFHWFEIQSPPKIHRLHSSKYVQEVYLNNKKRENLHFSHEELKSGSTLKIIMGSFEQASKTQRKSTPLFEKTYVDANGQTVTETVYNTTGEVFAFMTEYRKPDIIRELVPMIQSIYTQQQLEMDAPVTSGAVAMAFVKQIPFMATVGGMYALGAAGLDAAGDTISATVTGGSSFANNGGTASSDLGITNSGEGSSTSMDNTFTDDHSVDNSQTEQVK